MRVILALHIATLLCVSTTSLAATVEYQHPDLTIVARQEPLASVLKSLGREMRIYITIPTGLNPVVNCDIQQQPVKQAFKSLLGDVSYSLEWEEGGERLVGVTILGGEGGAVATVSNSPIRQSGGEQGAPAVIESLAGQGTAKPVAQRTQDTPMAPDDTAMADHDAAMAEHEARMEVERAEHEARMAEEREAQEVRMKEEVERHDAEMAAYLESQGLKLPQ